jgi:hypothetical protein
VPLVSCVYLIVSTLVVTVQIESHIKRLDEDLGQFAEDLKHGTSNYGRFLSLKNGRFYT